LPDPRDAAEERLWYMLSPAFDDAGDPINTDTLSNVTVYAGNNANVLTNQAVAVIFAPGPPLPDQARGTQTAACAVTGTTIAQSLCATNYLESASGINNASATGPFIVAPPTATFNDRVLVVTDSVQLITPIEARAAQAIRSALQAYKAGSGGFCNCYPWADTSNGIADEDDKLTHGRVPLISADKYGTGIDG
jgi:hypothetical protein